MNAHINYNLAQSLLAVISEPEFDDPERLAAQRVADLMAPGQVVLKLAVRGFGVRPADA